MEKQKCTIRLTKDEIKLINCYPGKNFTEKVRNLLAVQMIQMNGQEGVDLKEKYEIILKTYLEFYEPEIYSEMNVRRKELRSYTDTLEEVNILHQLAEELKESICKLNEKSKEYLEKRVADCVVVRKKKDIQKKNIETEI